MHLPKQHPALSHPKNLSRLRPQCGEGADDARRLARQHGWFVIALNAPVGCHLLTLLLCGHLRDAYPGGMLPFLAKRPCFWEMGNALQTAPAWSEVPKKCQGAAGSETTAQVTSPRCLPSVHRLSVVAWRRCQLHQVFWSRHPQRCC